MFLLNHGDLRQMIERSWKWANEHKLVRKNPVHGEEEAKLVLEDFFSSSVEHGESTNAHADGAFEDYFTCICPNDSQKNAKHCTTISYIRCMQDADGSMLDSALTDPAVLPGEGQASEEQVKEAAAVATAGKSK